MKAASAWWRGLSPAWRWALVVTAGCVVMAALNIWWISTYRDGYPLNVDESGYMAIGVVDYLALHSAGPHAWWDTIQAQAPSAPLLPAATSLLFLFGQGVMEGFITLVIFGALLTLVAYGVGERLAGPRLGALAALAVATSEGAFIYTREYIFALPTALFLLCSVYSLLRSDGMKARWWSIACGASVALMLLSRTMAVAFVPGVVAAALLAIAVRHRDGLGRRAINFGLAVLAGFLVAATWYWKNLDPVVDYLTEFGYGSQAQNYGEDHALISWGSFEAVAERLITNDLLVPMTVLVALGLLAGLVVVGLRLREADDRRAELFALAQSDALSVFLVAAAGYGALMSSQNAGNGFTFPVAMLLPPLAVICLRRFRHAVIPAVALVAGIGAINLVANSNVSENLSKSHYFNAPVLGDAPVIGGQPWMAGEPHAVGAIRVQNPGPLTHFDESEKAWAGVDSKLADILNSPITPEGLPRVTSFAFRHRVIGTNSVGLASLFEHESRIPLTQIQPEPDTVAHYREQITSEELGFPNVLVTTSTERGDFEPVITQKKVEAAAKSLGFRLRREVPMPDGRSARIWVQEEGAKRPVPAPRRGQGQSASG